MIDLLWASLIMFGYLAVATLYVYREDVWSTVKEAARLVTGR